MVRRESSPVLACRLTYSLLDSGPCGVVCAVLAHVVAGRRVPVLRPGGAPGAGLAGVRCAGRGEPARAGWPFPWAAQVGGQVPGDPELGVAGDDQPGPSVSGLRVADLRRGPAEDLPGQPEGVLDIEPAQKRLPAPVHVRGRGAGA